MLLIIILLLINTSLASQLVFKNQYYEPNDDNSTLYLTSLKFYYINTTSKTPITDQLYYYTILPTSITEMDTNTTYCCSRGSSCQYYVGCNQRAIGLSYSFDIIKTNNSMVEYRYQGIKCLLSFVPPLCPNISIFYYNNSQGVFMDIRINNWLFYGNDTGLNINISLSGLYGYYSQYKYRGYDYSNGNITIYDDTSNDGGLYLKSTYISDGVVKNITYLYVNTDDINMILPINIPRFNNYVLLTYQIYLGSYEIPTSITSGSWWFENGVWIILSCFLCCICVCCAIFGRMICLTTKKCCHWSEKI